MIISIYTNTHVRQSYIISINCFFSYLFVSLTHSWIIPHIINTWATKMIARQSPFNWVWWIFLFCVAFVLSNVSSMCSPSFRSSSKKPICYMCSPTLFSFCPSPSLSLLLSRALYISLDHPFVSTAHIYYDPGALFWPRHSTTEYFSHSLLFPWRAETRTSQSNCQGVRGLSIWRGWQLKRDLGIVM